MAYKIEIEVDEEMLRQLLLDRNRIEMLADEADPAADEERAQIEAEHSGILLGLLSEYLDNVDLPEDIEEEEEDEDLDNGGAGVCLQCEEEFSPDDYGQQFCSEACCDAYHLGEGLGDEE